MCVYICIEREMYPSICNTHMYVYIYIYRVGFVVVCFNVEIRICNSLQARLYFMCCICLCGFVYVVVC